MSKYPNSGTLARNKDQREGSRDPDFKGKAEIDGVGYWIAGWVKAGEYGKFFSLSFKPMEEKRSPPKSSPVEDEAGFDDDLPF